VLAQDLTPLAAQPKEPNKDLVDLTNDKNCEESTKSLHSKSATPAMCQARVNSAQASRGTSPGMEDKELSEKRSRYLGLYASARNYDR
jgi:hypothetical protein